MWPGMMGMAGLHECDLLPELVSSTLIVGVPASRTPEGVWVSTLRVLLVRWGVSGIGARCPSGISIFLTNNQEIEEIYFYYNEIHTIK